MRAPLDGSALTTLAHNDSVSAGLALDSGRLYWSTAGTSDGNVVAAPLAGGSLVTLASGGANGVAVGATAIAWTRAYLAEQGSVLATPK